MWNIPYVIDLDDHEGSGIKTFIRYHANGEPEEEMSAVLDGEGPHGLYNITDTVMCKMPTGVTPEEASKMAHTHNIGWELFFVDSGSMYLYTDGRRCLIKEGDIVKVHVHTLDPGRVLTSAREFGEFLTIKIENMELGHSDVEGVKKKIEKKAAKKAAREQKRAEKKAANSEE